MLGHKPAIELLMGHQADVNLRELRWCKFPLVWRRNKCRSKASIFIYTRGNTALQIASFYCQDPRVMCVLHIFLFGNSKIRVTIDSSVHVDNSDVLVTEGAEIDVVDNRKHSAVYVSTPWMFVLTTAEGLIVVVILFVGGWRQALASVDVSRNWLNMEPISLWFVSLAIFLSYTGRIVQGVETIVMEIRRQVDDDGLDAATRAADKGHLGIAQYIRERLNAGSDQATEL